MGRSWQTEKRKSYRTWPVWLAILILLLLTLWPRLTALNQYMIVDETDRWLWAKDFVQALHRGDLAGTLVGDGYPGIVPVWIESVWILAEAGRRSLVEGQWIGDVGLGHLLHEWDRDAMLFQQRLPVVLLNIGLALAVMAATWRLFGRWVGLVAGLLIALDPFYLSDSRVNRAEAVITGLMTLSILSLIFYYRQRQFRYVLISGLFGGLSFLTKIQALAILPVIFVVGLLIAFDSARQSQQTPAQTTPKDSATPAHSPISNPQSPASPAQSSPPASQSLFSIPYALILKFGLVWAGAAVLVWLLLWPAMWVTPLETITLVYEYTTRKVGAEGVNLFFLGQTYQDADPGVLFYPFVLLMRMTPLTLFGLLGAATRWGWSRKQKEQSGVSFAARGSLILVVYVLIYALVMTFGSHKQDRYLMPVFLALDILAAMGLVFIGYRLSVIVRSTRFAYLRTFNFQPSTFNFILKTVLFAGLVIIQVATVLPHHPYYYSYFNPLFGGGQTAVRTLRIGWGEGMDQAGRYLAAKPDSEALVVGARFGRNMLDFKGELVTLGEDGRWTRADYVVLYIQQVQRRLDPSPGFIDYFQARQPEKVITLGGIDYAWIYPVPFTTPAAPDVSRIPGQAALLGYRWEEAEERGSESASQQVSRTAPETGAAGDWQIRLVWKNLGLNDGWQLVARLGGDAAETGWRACQPDAEFVDQAGTPGAYVENLCRPDLADLPPGLYSVEFGVAAKNSHLEEAGTVDPFRFPEGRYAVRLTPAGQVVDTPEAERLNRVVEAAVPPAARLVDRVYNGKMRLAAYQLDPSQPRPGQTVELSLYWQAVDEHLEPVHLTVQLADSRSISLGRRDPTLSLEKWLYGEVERTIHSFNLDPALVGPLAGRIEVRLKNEAEIFLTPTTLAGQVLDQVVARFTIAPETWPTLDQATPVAAVWQTQAGSKIIALRGYHLWPNRPEPGESLAVSLFWEAEQPLAEDYMVFVHMVDQSGQLKAQHDSIPRAGAYPTPWWLPGKVVEDTHPVILPEDLPDGTYQLMVGLYRPEDGRRLHLVEGQDHWKLHQVEIR